MGEAAPSARARMSRAIRGFEGLRKPSRKRVSHLGRDSTFYNPNASLSSSVIACTDDWCRYSTRQGFGSCTNDLCSYNQIYGSGGSIGYLVSDALHLDVVGGNTSSFSTSVVFGCSTEQSGDLIDTSISFDGILGLGPSQESVTAQLNSVGRAPNVFSLCLKSSYGGNGILVLGEAVEPGLIYTPLSQSKIYYMLDLESISVNGQKLHIDSSVFEPSHGRGTIVDSGTTLAYLADRAYDPFVNAIAAGVSPSVHPVVRNGEQCFLSSNSLDLSFPTVTLHFGNGAVMTIKPQNYLLPEFYSDDVQSMYCIAWKRQQGNQQINILGDIVLRDKLVVYDLDNMRLGWVDYDCSQPVNVTTSHIWKKRHVNSGHGSYLTFIPTVVAITLCNMLIYGM